MAPLRLVIAEDASLILVDLCEMAAHLGHSVVGTARDGLHALELARLLKPDVVILDIQMPRLDGLSVAQHLITERIAPVVVLTGYTHREFIEQAQALGVAAYLVKPVSEQALGAAVERAFRQSGTAMQSSPLAMLYPAYSDS